MRRAWRVAAVFILTAISFLVAPQSACACSCALGSETEYVDHADLIFTGVVVDISGSTFTGGDLDVTFAVESVSKGDSPSRKTLRTAADGAACGYDFVLGHRFRVYAHGGATGLCSGNRALGAAPEVPVDSGQPFGWIAAGGGVAVALVVAFVVSRRRRVVAP